MARSSSEGNLADRCSRRSAKVHGSSSKRAREASISAAESNPVVRVRSTETMARVSIGCSALRQAMKSALEAR